jgi:hypothetical protein
MTFLMRRRRRRPALGLLAWTGCAVVFGWAFSIAALAQSGIGSIQGVVTDSTGAVIPGATVNVINTATRAVSSTTSNGVGFYQVSGLLAGTYEVSATIKGMKTTARAIELLVAQDAVLDFALQPGEVTEQVKVSGNAVQLVTTNNGEITATLENQRINQLPMNGRNIITLVNETTPGLESCPESSSCANGQEGPALEYEVDGATLTNREFGGVHQGSQQMVDPDAVQEVRVEDEAAGAQYASPATVILESKSGTNRLHGSLFETARNNAFGIARSRSNPSNYSAPEYIRNEFGASVGGPVVLPHLYHGKDRTFFFFAYERYSLAQDPFQNEMVPTQAMRNGDFSGLTNSSGVPQELYDPATTASSAACAEPPADGSAAPSNTYCRAPFPGSPALGTSYNYINPARESPLAQALNAMTPLPSNANDPMVASNLSGQTPELTVEPQITARIDQNFDESNRAYLRYTQNLTTSISPRNDPNNESYTLATVLPSGLPGSGDVIPLGASGISSSPSYVYAAALGFTHIFSPTFTSETVYSQSWYGEHNLAGGSPFTDYEAEMGLPNNFGEFGFPYIEGSSTSNQLFQPMDGTQFQYSVTTTTYDLDENLTKIAGKHQLIFGGRYRFEHFGSRPDEIKDELQFDGEATGLLNPSTLAVSSGTTAYANSGQLNADEFLGAAYAYSVNLEPPYQHLHDMELDAYLQDNWRVRNNLTLNLGLRYEAHPAVWEGQGAMMGFDFKSDAMVTSGSPSTLESEGLTTSAIIAADQYDDAKFESPAEAGLPPMLVNNNLLVFAPRFGVAWQPFGRWGTVLRGGLGRYTYPNPIREGYRDINRNNPFTAGYAENYTSLQYAPNTNYMLLATPNTSAGFNSSTTNPSQTVASSGGFPIMGTNTASIINNTSISAIAPGLTEVTIDPHFPPTYVNEANFTIEQPFKGGSALRVSYLYTHGTNLLNYFFYNDHPSEYSWEIQTGTAPPSSSAVGPNNNNTGEGPYDQVTYGSGSYQVQKTGWSNYNALQAEWEKLYHNGSAWQIMYVWEKNLRTGGDYGGESADEVDPYSAYGNSGPSTVTVAPAGSSLMPIAPNLPPPPPAGVPNWGYYKTLNRWENYMVDTNTPPQHLQFNGILDLPFGNGKRWLSGSRGVLNELVGGWQMAGSGNFSVSDFAVTTTNFGPTNPLHVYKRAKITDCRSGTCVKSYEWFNGYIAPTAISGNACSAGLSTVVNSLPPGWAPYEQPMDVTCSAPANGKAVTDKYFGENEVAMSGVTGQKSGTVIGYGIVPSNNNNGASEGAIDVTNPYSHTILDGPMNWTVNASLFKVFPIHESMSLRFNVDAFNLFNNQGLGSSSSNPNPNSTDGTFCYSAGGVGCSSLNTPRQLQLTARLSF